MTDITDEDKLRELLAEHDRYDEAAEAAGAVRFDVVRWARRYGMHIDDVGAAEEEDDGLEACEYCGSEYKDLNKHLSMSDCGDEE